MGSEMDIEELRAAIYEARKEFLNGKYSLVDPKTSLVHITQILTYVDLSIDDYKDLINDRLAELLSGKQDDYEDLVNAGIAKRAGDRFVPKNSLVIEAAREAGIEICDTRNDPINEAVLDLSYALDSLRIPNELHISNGYVYIDVAGKRMRTITIGIVQPKKAYRRSGDDVVKLWSYVPRFLSGSLGRKLLPIIIDLGITEVLKSVPLIYLPLGMLSLLVLFNRNIPAVAVYTPIYKKIEGIVS